MEEIALPIYVVIVIDSRLVPIGLCIFQGLSVGMDLDICIMRCFVSVNLNSRNVDPYLLYFSTIAHSCLSEI